MARVAEVAIGVAGQCVAAAVAAMTVELYSG